jgi:hypothetical protein
MKGIFTYKEFEQFRETEKIKGDKPLPEKRERPLEEAPLPFQIFDEEYFFFHPDNSINPNYYKEGIFKVEVMGKIVELPIVNGVLKTDNLQIRDILLKQKFIFMYIHKCTITFICLDIYLIAVMKLFCQGRF